MIFFSLSKTLTAGSAISCVPKNVSEDCITNDACQVECTESFSHPVQVNIKHMWML